MPWPNPVSYTHLDVYKRQFQGRPKRAFTEQSRFYAPPTVFPKTASTRNGTTCICLLYTSHAHRDLGDVLFIFRGGRRGRPDPVAEVVNGGTGHRGIQVNHANAFSGYIVQHHIVQPVSYTHLDVYKRQGSLPPLSAIIK